MDFNTTTDQYGDTSRFISLFNELDDYMGTRLCQEHGSWSDMNHIPFMDKLRELTGYQVIRAEHLHELREMAQLRNAILHGYGKAPGVNPKVIAIPLKTTVDRFEEICRVIMNPPKVYPAISVPARNGSNHPGSEFAVRRKSDDRRKFQLHSGAGEWASDWRLQPGDIV